MKFYIRKRKIEFVALIISSLAAFSSLFTLSITDIDVVKMAMFTFGSFYMAYLISKDSKEIQKRLKRKKKHHPYNNKAYDEVAFQVYERRLCYGENIKKMSKITEAA